jgi:KDO2-lipid IV(A) lauroyltransferase
MVKTRTPTWKDFAAGGQARRQWFTYWLWDTPLDGLQWLLFHALGILPISLVSRFGAILVARFIVPFFVPDAIVRSIANLRWLEPTWSEARVREVSRLHFESIGRLKAEFSVLHRLARSGRISVDNAAITKKATLDGPVILIGTHIGNWEILSPVMAELDIPVFSIFEPQPSRMQTRLALKVRAKCGPAGSVAFARGTNALAAAAKWLQGGGTLIIFCDEPVNGVSAAPFFGRPPHLKSNYAFAARLARLSDATLIPFHTLRHPDCRFTLRFHSPIKLEPTDSPGGHLLKDVIQLNASIEPVIREHLDQWFWLGWGFAGVNYPASNR